MSQMIVWEGREVWVSDHKAEWVTTFGKLLEESCEKADFDVIQGRSRHTWQPRWLQRFLMAGKWYDWSPSKMWKAVRAKRKVTVWFGVGMPLCHRVSGGSHRRGRYFRTCGNCGGPL